VIVLSPDIRELRFPDLDTQVPPKLRACSNMIYPSGEPYNAREQQVHLLMSDILSSFKMISPAQPLFHAQITEFSIRLSRMDCVDASLLENSRDSRTCSSSSATTTPAASPSGPQKGSLNAQRAHEGDEDKLIATWIVFFRRLYSLSSPFRCPCSHPGSLEGSMLKNHGNKRVQLLPYGTKNNLDVQR